MTLDLRTPLLDYGLDPIPEGDWAHRGRHGSFHPIGTANHHTGGSRRGGVTASLGTVINGRGGANALAGPLCNGYVDRDGRPHLVAAGRANHGGAGYTGTLKSVMAGHPVAYYRAPQPDDGADGNGWYLGIEVENDGVGELYSDRVIETVVLMNAAWADAFGWHPAASIHHRQHTRRKVDMSIDLDLPTLVAAAIGNHGVPVPMPPTPTPNQWEILDVKIIQHPVKVLLGPAGNGYGDVPCRANTVVGHPRYSGSVQLNDVPGMFWETYEVAGHTRVEVSHGPGGKVVEFVVSEAAT